MAQEAESDAKAMDTLLRRLGDAGDVHRDLSSALDLILGPQGGGGCLLDLGPTLLQVKPSVDKIGVKG